MNAYHTTVLLKETIDYLGIRPEQKYIDATLGGGGHTFEIINRGGQVLSIDSDEEAINHTKAQLKKENVWKVASGSNKITLRKTNFSYIKKIAEEEGFNKVNGIVFDLGVSGHQFDSAERGFSFNKTGPLDMRMDSALTVNARDLVNGLTKGELYELFTQLGEERFARSIANAISNARKIKKIETTKELTDIINQVVPGKLKQDTSARVYQAIRIAVNDEINNLRSALPQAFDLLDANGKLAVISFHSLEDRVVKSQFANWRQEGLGIILTKKPIRPTENEIKQNSRSRSAKLRVIQKK
jgi:16S rRNA (cytosine1402-N4)-methyltransferase